MAPSNCVTISLLTLCIAAAEAIPTHRRGFKRMPRPLLDEANFGLANITAADLAATPSSIDWSERGALTPINDQGDCGSCWAFSTMQTVESAVYMSTGKLPEPLSVQQLVACDRRDDGCDGGDPQSAVRYLRRAGGEDTAYDYPDTSSENGRTGKCKWDGKSAVTVSGFQRAVPGCTSGHKECTTNEFKLAAAVAKYGPLSISINSGDGQASDWEKYKGGVLGPKCRATPNLVDHSVQLVGFDMTASTPYWKVRNTWGKSWGENGFIRLPMGENSCCIGCEALIIHATAKSDFVVV